MNRNTVPLVARAHGWTCLPRTPQTPRHQELRHPEFRVGNIVTVPGQGSQGCDTPPQGDSLQQVLNPFAGPGHDLS